MENNIYSEGTFSISNKTMKLLNKTVNLSNIETMEVVPCDRHSIFSGLKQWLSILVILIIVCNIWKKYMFIGDIYIYTIFILLGYNIIMFLRKYYVLVIQIGVSPILIRSRDPLFLENVRDTIQDAIDNTSNNTYTVNLDNCTINNGIINKGNNNTNKVR